MSSQPIASTRERILQIARDLILSRGFNAMSIDMVCRQANITKGGFFHHFSNKETLGEAVLEQFWQDALERQQHLFDPAHHQSQLELLTAYIDHGIASYQDPQLSQGCMLAIFTMGLADTHPSLFEVSRNYFQAWRKELIDILQRLQQEQGSPHFDTIAWAELYITTLEGALLLAKSMDDTQVIVRTLSLYKQQLVNAANMAHPR